MAYLNTMLRYTFKVFKIFLIALICLALILFAYIRYNKKNIIAQVTAQIEKKLNGKVTLGDVDLTFFKSFPKIAVLVKDISVTDTMYAAHGHTFFMAKEVFVSLNVFSLLKKEPALGGIRINEGNIYLFTDTSGYTNTYLLHPRNGPDTGGTAGSNTGEVSLKNITLKHVDIIVDDKRKHKYHNLLVKHIDIKLQDADSVLTLQTSAEILVNSLAFNTQKGSFAKGAGFSGNFTMQYRKPGKVLQFDSIAIKLAGQPFNLSGSFDLGNVAPQFALRLHTKNAAYQKIRSLLTPKIDSSLSIVDLSAPLNADAVIRGPLKGGEPFIYAAFNTSQAHFTTPFLDFDTASFKGFFTNEVVPGKGRTDSNSTITLDHFLAGWHGLPLTLNSIVIANLANPVLNCDIHSAFALTQLNEVLTTNSLQLNAGQGGFDVTYSGPLVKNSNTNALLNGTVNFSGAEIVYTPRNVTLKNLSAAMVFKNSDLTIQDMRCIVLGNSFIMSGTGKNLLSLVNTEPSKININWNIYSPQLNLDAFTYLLQNRTATATAKKDSRYFGQMATRIDALLEESSISIALQTGRLLYHKFQAENVTASLSLLQDRYVLNNVQLNHGGGQMTLNGTVINQRPNYHPATLNVKMNSIDVKQLFTAFDNFGQDAITAQNLQGRLSTTATAAMVINDAGKVVPASIKSSINFSLKNGTLTDYEPVKKLQNFLFRKRDFDNISFAELKDQLTIADQKIYISRMEIQSSVLSMFVEGTYSQSGDGTDISIQVPFSNLKKRGNDYNPENIGTDKKGGRSIFIRGRPDSDGKIKFKLDLFNRFKKDKVAAAG